MRYRWIASLSFGALVAPLIGLVAVARASDDAARFYGTWVASAPYNGRTVTMVSVHDTSGYKNYVGDTPIGSGQFSAANGRWTATANRPNDTGTYRFIDDNTVVCTNAVGRTVTWRRASVRRAAANDAAAQAATAVPQSGNASLNRAIAAFERKDYNTAWREFMAAAQQGDAEAQAGVGAMLFRHLNPPGTGYYAQCENWLIASAKQGNLKGMGFLGQFYYADGVAIAGGINPGINNAPIPPALRRQAERRFALAREWFERASALGDRYAMGNLAIMLAAGVGGPADLSRAAQLRASVAKGPDADFARRATQDPDNLALIASWQAGHYADAIRNAEARAARGDANAEALLGRAYYEGVGVGRNYAVALRWLNQAVAQKNADAMFFLGLMHEHGRGVPQNIPESLKLFDRAAGLGQRYAEMEAKGMRMQGESNRLAALAHANSSTEDIACETAGGISTPGACIRGGANIDPYAAWKNESH